MATSSPRLNEDCLCPVCCDLYTDPVVLQCGHSFCKVCLQGWWAQSGTQTCPLCKEMFPVGQPARNLALRNLSDTLKQEAASRTTELLCETHGERLKLYCVDHQKPICLICQDSKDHKKHDCVPIDEAAADSRKKLEIALNELKPKLNKLNEEKVTCNKMSTHIQVQAQLTEKKIKEEFQKLYQFLHAEEATRLDTLRAEVKQKSEAMNIRIVNLTTEISSLSDTMKATKTELETADLPFMLVIIYFNTLNLYLKILYNYKAVTQRAQCTVPDPKTPSGALIDEASHRGNLLFHVWQKMKSIIQSTPFCMDSNTVKAGLILSEDLTSLTTCTLNDVPSNPERCEKGVLGSVGFTSGTHYWDVQGGEYWTAGVLSKTKIHNQTLYWQLFFTVMCGPNVFEYTSNTKHSGSMIVDDFPKKIRVELNYDDGKLSFYDLDKGKFIYKSTCQFVGPIFPFFDGNIKILHCPV